MYLEMVESNLEADAHLKNMQKKTYLCIHLGMEGLRIISTNPIRDQIAMTPHQAFLDTASRQFAPQITLAKDVYDFHHRHQEP